MSQLAQDHLTPPPLPGGMGRSDVIVVEYDIARDYEGSPVVYSVISEGSLRHVPTDVLAGVGINQGSEFAQGDPAFFVGNSTGTRLYVDTDRFPTFIDDLADWGQEVGLHVFNSLGNLRACMNDEGQIVPPRVPAFVEMEMEQIDTDVALQHIEFMHSDMARDRLAEKDVDDGSSPGFE